MFEIALLQSLALVSLTTIAVLLIVFGWREFRLSKKIELLKHLIDKGYQSVDVDFDVNKI